MNNRYLVAKYAPDIKRMEPENIGVFLWVDGSVSMRFLKDKDAPFIQDHDIYRRWLEFWQLKITASELAPIRGEVVPKTSPKFLDALRDTQEGNYLLFDGGRVSTPIIPSEIDEAAGFLFDEFVSRKKIAEEHDSMSEIADRTIRDAGLYERIEMQYPMTCKLFGVSQEVKLNYAVVEDGPLAVMQRVSSRGQQSAAYAALVFDSLVGEKKIDRKGHCASLINSAEGTTPSIIKMLGKVSTVIDLADEPSAVKALRRMAG